MTDSRDFLLEKYRYVLSRKKELNEATFKIVAIYQAAIAALAVGQFTVIASIKSGSIPSEFGENATKLLFALLILTTFLTLALLIGGICSWFKYKRDEGEIETEIYGRRRSLSNQKSFLSWYETYIIIAVVLFSLFGIFGYLWYILPSINKLT